MPGSCRKERPPYKNAFEQDPCDYFKHVASAVYELGVRAPVVGKCTIVTNEEPYFRIGQYFTYSAWAFGWCARCEPPH